MRHRWQDCLKKEGASMRVIFVNRYFHPDQSATSRMVSALAFGLA